LRASAIGRYPRGERDASEYPIVTAEREFDEETGLKPLGPSSPLRSLQQKGGNVVHAWAFAGDCSPAT